MLWSLFNTHPERNNLKLHFCLAPLLLFLNSAEFTKILIWNLSWLEGEMSILLHICLLMVKEAYIPDQGWGKGSVFTGEMSGVGQVNKGWKVEKETV